MPENPVPENPVPDKPATDDSKTDNSKTDNSVTRDNQSPEGLDVPDLHDTHGSTPAAWTAVTIIMFAFLVGAVGILIKNAPVFWVGVGLVAVGIIVGKIMQMMGMGAPAPADRRPTSV